jgi:hypothetical protein
MPLLLLDSKRPFNDIRRDECKKLNISLEEALNDSKIIVYGRCFL